MSSQRYTPEFKDEAVRQVLERAMPREAMLLQLATSLPNTTPKANLVLMWSNTGIKPTRNAWDGR